ncbi:MAG: SlyX family protein [Sterolibacterium sp.]
MESRIAEIEIKLSFSEDMLDELSKTVFRQQQQIEKLQKELRVLSLQSQNDDTQTSPRDLRDEIPPHY